MDVSTTVFALPPGVILAYSAATAPSGYILCDGSAVSRTTYASLYATLGVTHGSGDGSTTFNIPDYRGRFLRGVDGGTARDPDAAGRTAMNSGGNTGSNVGSVQAADYLSHTHTQNAHSHTEAIGNGSSTGAVVTQTSTSPTGGTLTGNNTTATNNNSGGNETRPLNAYVSYIIKT